jgi:hypothetical protein
VRAAQVQGGLHHVLQNVVRRRRHRLDQRDQGSVLGFEVGRSRWSPNQLERRDDRVQIGNLENAFKLYNARKGKFPDTATGFKALVDMEIIDKLPKDAWGNDYVYVLESGRPVITSYGADGVPGGDGPNSDITNRPTTAQKP